MPDFNPILRDEPDIVSGMRDPEQLNSIRIIADVDDEIHRYMPSSAPLTAISTKIRKTREVSQATFRFLEQDQYPRRLDVAAASTAGDTTIDVATGQGTRAAAAYVYQNTRTGEHVRVSSISSNELTVTRGIGSAAQAMEVGDVLILTRAVYEDGSDIGTVKTVKEDAEYNYTEIIRTPVSWSGREENIGLYGGGDVESTRKWVGIEHSKSIEMAYIFGQRHSTTGSNSRQLTFTGGLKFFIRSNVWDLNSTIPTERAFMEFMEEAMKWGRGGNLGGSRKKWMFCSSRWLTTITSWSMDRLRVRTMESLGGLDINEYKTPHGTIFLVHNPLFDEVAPADAVIIDMNHFRKVHFKGRNTKLLKNRQGNGVDGSSEEYLSDVGAQVELEASHAWIKGLQL